MGRLLYLVHRMPYPPDKGDKLRSYHLLKHLRANHEVHLGTFIDDPADAVHIETLRGFCASMHVEPLSPRASKLRSLEGLWRNQALTLGYYRSTALGDWVRRTVAEQGIDTAVVFSSSMAQYVDDLPDLRTIVDFVDVDSAKWSQYAAAHRWPMSWLYRREGDRLLAYERGVAVRARRSFFVTQSETALFSRMAPECAQLVEPMGNGVDADFFAPDPAIPSPFAPDETALVFTGAMDYWPNVDAVGWFANDIFPRLRTGRPGLRFHIVGRSPAPAVQALASDTVRVTGTVPDVRPYLQHASVVVAPLRLARGIQNKVLEAMAMGKAVVASSECAQAIDARDGAEFAWAADADAFVANIEALLASPAKAYALGAAARQRVVARYSWAAHLAGIDQHLVDDGVAA